jgi:hypothetical protein
MAKTNEYLSLTRPVDDINVTVKISGRGQLSPVTMERLRQLAKHAALELAQNTKQVRGETQIENSSCN